MRLVLYGANMPSLGDLDSRSLKHVLLDLREQQGLINPPYTTASDIWVLQPILSTYRTHLRIVLQRPIWNVHVAVGRINRRGLDCGKSTAEPSVRAYLPFSHYLYNQQHNTIGVSVQGHRPYKPDPELMEAALTQAMSKELLPLL